MQFLYQIVWTNVLALIFFTSSYYKFDIKRHMGTNSLYPIFTDKQQELNSPSNCKLEKLLLVARHGTRYPEDVDINKFDELEKVFHDVPGRKKYKVNSQKNADNFTDLFILLNKQIIILHSGKKNFRYHKMLYYILEVRKNIIYWENVLLRNITSSGKKLFLMILTLLNLEVQKLQGTMS